MKDGDAISFETSLEKTVTLRLNREAGTTRVDQDYWIKILFPDGRYLRRDIGNGTYVLKGLYDDPIKLQGVRAPKKIAGMTYAEAVELAHGIMIAMPPGLHPKVALEGFVLIDPHEAKPKRLSQRRRPADN